jgi:GH25 family lysozyme M1 (1,4-beta-N-acetylmuramidase)
MEFIDCSKWNGPFDWQKSVNKGVEGAWLKASGCGIGGNYVDYRFKENSQSCPLPYKGSYHYFDYEGRKSGADQCKFFLDTVGNFGNLRGVLDLEDNSGHGWVKLSSVMGNAMKEALSWVNQYFLECGHWPILYLNTGLTILQQWTVTGYKYTFRNFTECPLWVANYNDIQVPPTGAWETYAAWQWTSGGDGLAYGNSPGNVSIDLNRINNLNALLKPGITIEDPVIIPPVVVDYTDKQKLDILWEAYKTYTK